MLFSAPSKNDPNPGCAVVPVSLALDGHSNDPVDFPPPYENGELFEADLEPSQNTGSASQTLNVEDRPFVFLQEGYFVSSRSGIGHKFPSLWNRFRILSLSKAQEELIFRARGRSQGTQ